MGHKIWSSFDRSLVWWRRRELFLAYKLLINIPLMGLKIGFCYILCYIKCYLFLSEFFITKQPIRLTMAPTRSLIEVFALHVRILPRV